jgi:hypothetical protein
MGKSTCFIIQKIILCSVKYFSYLDCEPIFKNVVKGKMSLINIYFITQEYFYDIPELV